MPSRTLATLSILAAGILAPATVADAAAKKVSKYPTVKKIAPMTVSVGETMTLTGTGYVKGKGKNTVVFRRSGKRTIFAKADGLSSTRLSVVVPEKVRVLLGKSSTRVQIRVLAKRFGKGYTPLSKSPTVLVGASKTTAGTTPTTTSAPAPTAAATPAAKSDPPPPPPNCDNDGQVDSVDADDDNDLLPDTLEATLNTNRCLVDTDGDSMEDGWEYQSAVDLNRESCPSAEYPVACTPVRPYPGKRPYPNPLNPDAGVDYDGDWLNGYHEHIAWQRKGRASSSYRTLNNMWYSDGLQGSRDTDPTDGCRGIAAADMPAPLMGDPDYTLDRENPNGNGLGCLTDDERDEDGDFLTNVEEAYNQLENTDWWEGVYEEPLYKVKYEGTDWLDPDTDGDGIVDGKDDQDFDDFWNAEEMERGSKSTDLAGLFNSVTTGLWVDPYNPCLPAIKSRTCPRFIPSDADVWMPFWADQRSTKRWPLYKDPVAPGDPEVWSGVASPTLPPVHPIPRPS